MLYKTMQWMYFLVEGGGGGLEWNFVLAEAIVVVLRGLSPLPLRVLLGVGLLVGHGSRFGNLVLPASIPGPVTGAVQPWGTEHEIVIVQYIICSQ